jgi:xylulokinase
MVMGVTQAAGFSLRWFRDQFGAGTNGHGSSHRDSRGDSYDTLTADAANAPPGCDGLLWAPYLMGKRTPFDPAPRGVLVGLTASHTRAHVIRAILEGVAFSLRDTFIIFQEIEVPVEIIRLGGGGARSPLWRQIQADVYGQRVEMAEEGAAYGAAILAGVGAQNWPSVDNACNGVVRVAGHVDRNSIDSVVMDRAYAVYRRIYPAMKSILN